MAKKRDEHRKEKKSRQHMPLNLDGDFISPIRSFRDLTFKNINTVLTHSRYAQILIFLTVVGLILRFYHLSFNSLWLDEATTLDWSKPGFFEIWDISRNLDFHPPLFHWIEHLMLVFGQSEFVLRAVPALLGILTIPVFYLTGKEFYDRNVGIISAALLTVSYFGIYYSQEAYSYSLVLFAFSLVILFYLYALRTDIITWWVIFGVTSAIAFWTHYYVFVGLGVIYLHAIITRASDLKKDIRQVKNLLIACCTTLILSLPLLFIVGERFFRLTGSPPTYGVLGPILIQETFIRFSGGYSSLNTIIAFIYVVLMMGGFLFLYLPEQIQVPLFSNVSHSSNRDQCADIVKDDDESQVSYLSPSRFFCARCLVLSDHIPVCPEQKFALHYTDSDFCCQCSSSRGVLLRLYKRGLAGICGNCSVNNP